MSLAMLKASTSPIALDFGVSSLKALQLEGGDDPTIIAAAALETPEELLVSDSDRLAYQLRSLPALLKGAGFKGKRAVCSISATRTLVQQFMVPDLPGKGASDMLRQQLMTAGRDPNSLIIRELPSGDLTHQSQKQRALLCIAMPRDVVMEHMQALRGCKLDAVGIHDEHTTLLRVFDPLQGIPGAESQWSIVIDLGAGTTKVMIAQGAKLRIAKSIPIGGRDVDAALSKVNSCAMLQARERRLRSAQGYSIAPCRESAGGGAGGVAVAVREGVHPVIGAVIEEIRLCLSYLDLLHPSAELSRVYFTGGEANNDDLCAAIADELGLPSTVADPLAALSHGKGTKVRGVDLNQALPGWATAYGLCVSPTDL